MIIEQADHLDPSELAACEFSSEIEAEFVTSRAGDSLGALVAVPRQHKTYSIDPLLLSTPGDGVLRAIFVARQERLVGYVVVSSAWNNVAQIDDLAVDCAARRLGIASKLLTAAVLWAKQAGLPGIRLETQTNNVAACRLYEQFGFELTGFDRALYRGLTARSTEVALFWYLPLGVRGS